MEQIQQEEEEEEIGLLSIIHCTLIERRFQKNYVLRKSKLIKKFL